MIVIPRTPNELMAFMALSPTTLHRSEQQRWNTLFRTAVWCLWKAFLSYSLQTVNRYWSPVAAVSYYREVIKRGILTERTLSLSERYSNRRYNKEVFKEVWGEAPQEIRILRGPKCMWEGDPTEDQEFDEPTGSISEEVSEPTGSISEEPSESSGSDSEDSLGSGPG